MAANIMLITAAILVATNFLITCLTLLVAYNVYQENGTFASVSQTVRIISIACDALSMHPDDDYETFEENKNIWTKSVNRQGQYVCETKNITDIIEKVVEKQSRVHLASALDGQQYMSCGNQSLVRQSGEMTAYFTSVSWHQSDTETEIQTKVHWNSRARHSYIHPNIIYNNGEVTILEGRTYFVYASVTFNLSQSEEQALNKPYNLTLRICRKNYGYERTILGKIEVYNTPVRGIVTSLNVAGHILLQKDDILLVRVSNSKWIHHNSKGNTFGLFPV